MQENSMLLLSSANDGKLVLWDLRKQLKQEHSCTQSTPPLKVTEAGDIHSNGIFSMDEVASHIATASKDSTIGYSRIADQGILRDRSISGHHCGPIRGVNFRNESIMADCGADGLICILDMRLSEPLVISIDTDSATGVNVAEWCPSQENLLLSASKDPHIFLYDIRNPNKFLHKLSGHIDPKLQKCSHIYRPTFVDQGRVVASPGQGSKAISLYCVETGKAISRGHLGYDPNMVLWSSCGLNSSPSLWVASRSISQLIPLYSNVSG